MRVGNKDCTEPPLTHPCPICGRKNGIHFGVDWLIGEGKKEGPKGYTSCGICGEKYGIRLFFCNHSTGEILSEIEET